MSRIRGTRVELATEKILSKIENYELMTGDVVSDIELSKEFGMSRTPIREAIMVLLENGILERTKTKVIVKPITLSDIIEILQVRESIESKSIELIIENHKLTNVHKKELEKIHTSLKENISSFNFKANFEADESFHEKIIELSGNNRFLDIYKRLCLQSKRLRWITLLTPDRYVETQLEHSKIIESILNLDVSSAQQSLRTHLLNTQKNYEEILNNPQWSKIAQEIKTMANEVPAK